MFSFLLVHSYLCISSIFIFFFFLMIRRPPRSTLSSSSAASDVYKRQYQRRVRGSGWRAMQRTSSAPEEMEVADENPTISRVMSSLRQANPVLRAPIGFDQLNSEYASLSMDQQTRLEQALTLAASIMTLADCITSRRSWRSSNRSSSRR
eukprot:TRINITY_DN13405_c0_g1_i2.p1 TRINITY_DN13405_c0_g1~~TRINITY_DN13405_c0_g1_i2.p1  ORF type:complete len:150 (-),score=45.39 TRINITY_DN13405_c0_g1_i2:454-903(-)